MQIVYLNGEFLPLDQARVPVLDRGFIFGDAIYEVIPVYAGKPFRLAEHFARLENSLAAIQLTNPYTREKWSELINAVIAHNAGDNQALYLQITRGVAKRNHKFPDHSEPTVFMLSEPMVDPAPSAGVKAITQPDTRWQHCDIKTTALLANVLLRQSAVEQGAAEAILIRDGMMTEGAASNIFIVKAGVAYTPPKGKFILPGITRDLIIETLQEAGIAYAETELSETDLRQADEIWMCSSTREIVPIIELDGQPVGDGSVGALWQQVWDLLQAYKHKIRSAHA